MLASSRFYPVCRTKQQHLLRSHHTPHIRPTSHATISVHRFLLSAAAQSFESNRVKHLSITYYSILQISTHPLFLTPYPYHPSHPPYQSSPAPQGTPSSPSPCCSSRPSGALLGRQRLLSCLCGRILVCHQNNVWQEAQLTLSRTRCCRSGSARRRLLPLRSKPFL